VDYEQPTPYWRHALAVLLLGLLPTVLAVWHRSRESSGFAGLELLTYPLIFGTLGIALLLAAQRQFIRRPLRELSPGAGRLALDMAWGLALTALYFLLFFLARATLMGALEFRPNQEMLGLMLDLREHTWMVLTWFGPVLWIGIALFEELLRVFLLTRLWSLSCRWVWIAISIGIVALMMGLAHWSQGPYGVVTISIKGILIGAWFYRYRRLLPLVIAHALYDGLQVGMLLLTYPR
jgi:membrane protease YdiL (CAAX protease family)